MIHIRFHTLIVAPTTAARVQEIGSASPAKKIVLIFRNCVDEGGDDGTKNRQTFRLTIFVPAGFFFFFLMAATLLVVTDAHVPKQEVIACS